MRVFLGFSTPKRQSIRQASVQLALVMSLVLGLIGTSASAEDLVCEPNDDCARACVVDAWSTLRSCIADGNPFMRCARAAAEQKRACVIADCGPMPGCEERCKIHGKRLLKQCLQEGGDLDRCRAEAHMATEACIEAECHDCVCPDVYDPVCGRDGMTYGNACEASCAQVPIVHEGICEPKCEPVPCLVICPLGHDIGPDGCPTCDCRPPPGCQRDDQCDPGQVCRQICRLHPCLIDDPECGACTGVCLQPPPPPCLCAEIYDPVCGVDGMTYSNSCFAGCENVEIEHEGRCDDSCRANTDCGEGDVCYPPSKTCQPECAIQCFRYDPVCGEDGVTYGCGEADAHCHGVEVDHPGECLHPCESATGESCDLQS